MDMLNALKSDKNMELIGALTGKGFSMDQAVAFLPPALEGIVGAVKGMDITKLLGMGTSEQVAAVSGKLDMGALSGLLGGNRELAQNGITALLPSVLCRMKDIPGLGGVTKLASLAKGLFN